MLQICYHGRSSKRMSGWVCFFVLLALFGGRAFQPRKLAQNLAWAVLALLINVCTLPIIWLTALPIGDINSYHQKHDVVDQDLAWRIWRPELQAVCGFGTIP